MRYPILPSLGLLVASWLVSHHAHAQAPAAATALTGLVLDAQAQPVPGATVRLVHLPDSAVAAGTQADGAGRYAFGPVAGGRYLVRATGVGLREARSATFALPGPAGPLVLPALRLRPDATQLKEVTVTGQQKRVEVSAGKVVYNVAAQVAAAGTTAFDVLQRTPGVSVTQDDNIVLKGNANVTVLLDGKLTYLSPQQLSAFLKSTPAENLARIEVITAPGAQFDAAGSAGLLNIVTKKSTRQGYALNLTAGGGTGHNPQTTEALIGNVKTARFNLFGNYGYTYKHTYLHRTSYRIVDNVAYDRDSFDPAITSGHSYKAGLDLQLGPRQQAGLVYSGFHNTYDRSGAGPTTITDLGSGAAQVVQNRNSTYEPAVNNSLNVNYKALLDTAGRQLTADGDYARYANDSRGALGSQYFAPDGTPAQPYQELAFAQPVRITIRSLKTDLTWPVRKTTLSAGLKYSYVTSDNNFRYDSLRQGAYVYSPTLSNHFTYDERIYAAYAAASRPLGAATTLDAGLRAERTRSSGQLLNLGQVNDRDYTYLFPSLALMRKLSAQNSLSLALNRRINRPLYGNLNPSRYFFDKFSYYQGNPYLRPETAWNASAAFTYKNDYSLTLSASRTEGPISDYAYQLDQTGVLVVTPANFARRLDYDALLIVPTKLAAGWQMQNTVDLRYLTYDFRQGGTTFSPGRFTLDVVSVHTFRLPWQTTLEATGIYTSPALNGVYLYKHYLTVDGGFRRALAHGKLDARLSCTDLFNTIHYWGASIYEGANIRYNHVGDNRRVNLSFTYHLGGKLTAVKARAVEEAGRVK